jgi:hypothetical protein
MVLDRHRRHVHDQLAILQKRQRAPALALLQLPRRHPRPSVCPGIVASRCPSRFVRRPALGPVSPLPPGRSRLRLAAFFCASSMDRSLLTAWPPRLGPLGGRRQLHVAPHAPLSGRRGERVGVAPRCRSFATVPARPHVANRTEHALDVSRQRLPQHPWAG